MEAPRCINGAMPEGSISVTFGHRLLYIAAKQLLEVESRDEWLGSSDSLVLSFRAKREISLAEL